MKIKLISTLWKMRLEENDEFVLLLRGTIQISALTKITELMPRIKWAFMIVQTKCKLNNAELFLKPALFYIWSKNIWNQKYCEESKENLKNFKVRFRLNIDDNKEKEDSWLIAIKTMFTSKVSKLKLNRPIISLNYSLQADRSSSS